MAEKEEKIVKELKVEPKVEVKVEPGAKEVLELMEQDRSTRDVANFDGGTIFNCPKCGKGKIKRTFHERQLAVKYVCPQCQFVGPN